MTDSHAAGHTGAPTFKDRALRAVAILGLIALLLLGAWGIIQIAFTLYGFMSNAAPTSPAAVTTKTEQIVATIPSTIQSGTPFTLSFTHQNASGNYAYQFSYSCASGLSVQAPLPTGGTKAVPCNTPFNYTNANAQVQLTATAAGSAPIAATFTVAAKSLANNTITASTNANTTVQPAQTTKPTTSSTSKPSTTYVPAKTAARTLYGSPDLSVTVGQVTNYGGRYSVQFTIQNIGTNVAPAGWTFNASLPVSSNYTYTSNSQQALNPGDKIVYTLGFSGVQSGYSYGYVSNGYPANCGYTPSYTYNGVYNYPGVTYSCNQNYNYTNTYYNNNPYSYNSYGSRVTVTVDPYNYVYESSENNNSASTAAY